MSTTEEEKSKQAAMKYKKIEVIAKVVAAVAAVASVVVGILALQNRDTDSSVISPEAPSPTGAASQNQNKLLNTPVITTSPSPNSLRPSQTTVNKNQVSNDDNDDKDDRNERDSND